MRNMRGVTLLEMLVALSLFAVVGLVLAFSFSRTGLIWRRVSGTHDTQNRLKKARHRIASDLKKTSFKSVLIGHGNATLGPEDGSYFTLLSAVDPSTGAFVRTSTGTPLWQRNILYYLTVPKNHNSLFGVACTGTPDSNGYEIACPHKVLIRKVIDTGPPTDPTDPTTIEEPIAATEAALYLTRPDQFDTSSMLIETGLDEATIVTTNLLSLTAELAPNKPKWPGEVRVRLATVDIATAEREVIIGKTGFDEDNSHRADILLQFFPALP